MSDTSKSSDCRFDLLQEMGIGPVWVRRDEPTADIEQPTVTESPADSAMASENHQRPQSDLHTVSTLSSSEHKLSPSDSEIAAMGLGSRADCPVSRLAPLPVP